MLLLFVEIQSQDDTLTVVINFSSTLCRARTNFIKKFMSKDFKMLCAMPPKNHQVGVLEAFLAL